jgi:L-asparaginase
VKAFRRTALALFTACTLPMIAFSAAAQDKPVVQFIATGGTIAMKIDPVKNAPVPAISGDDLLATVPWPVPRWPAPSSRTARTRWRKPPSGWT